MNELIIFNLHFEDRNSLIKLSHCPFQVRKKVKINQEFYMVEDMMSEMAIDFEGNEIHLIVNIYLQKCNK